MAEPKFKPSEKSVDDFIEAQKDEQVRDDCRVLIAMMKKVTGSEPKLWGTIVGFGKYHYKYASGHEGDSCLAGFSPRKTNLTIYMAPGFEQMTDLPSKLGKHKASKGCIYIKKLDDIDLKVLEKLVRFSVDFALKTYPQ